MFGSEWSILLLGIPPPHYFFQWGGVCVCVCWGDGRGVDGSGGRSEVNGWVQSEQLQSTQTAKGHQTRHRSHPQNTSVNKQHPPQVQFQEPFDLQDGLRGVSEDPYQVVIFLFQQLLAHWDLEQNNYCMTDLALTVKVFNTTTTRTRKWITMVQFYYIFTISQKKGIRRDGKEKRVGLHKAKAKKN